MSFFVSSTEARELGLTHEGTMFGLPVWMGEINTDAPMICPKFQPGRYWLFVGDLVADALTYVLPDTVCFDTMTIKGPIK